MKASKALMALAAVALIAGAAAHLGASNDTITTAQDLPQAAQTTISDYFGDKVVALVKKETQALSISYEVIFADGSKIEFDSEGEWEEVKCRNPFVPLNLLPAEIASYVSTNYPSAAVVEIDKGRKKYEVNVNNHIEIDFNTKFEVIEIEIDN